MTAHCPLCVRVADWREGHNPYFVHEFTHSILMVGDHQFHPGYCVMVLKRHVRELHDLSSPDQLAIFAEVMAAGQALHAVLKPWRLNYACYGNQVEHIHWHIFPRYEADAERTSNPWLHADRFDAHRIDNDTATRLAQSIRAGIAPPPG